MTDNERSEKFDEEKRNLVHVFVYGTLKKGYHNHSLIKDSFPIPGAWRATGYKMYHLGGFPGVKFTGDARDCVFGEVYLVDQETLARLDRLEGVPHLYYRATTDVVDDSLNVKSVNDNWIGSYIYVFNGHVEETSIIDSGEWE